MGKGRGEDWMKVRGRVGLGAWCGGVSLGHASPLEEQARAPHLTLSHMIITVDGKKRIERGRERGRKR